MIGSVVRAVKIVNCFTDYDCVLGITQLAHLVGLAPSSVHHIVDSLCSEGVLQRLPNNKYTLGFKVVEWGIQCLNVHPVTQVSSEPMKNLMKQFNETVHLAIYDPQHGEMVYLQKFECTRSLRISTQIGARQPSHSTSLGKVYLAYGPKSLAFHTAEFLTPRTRNTIVDREQFLKELETIRIRGYAIDNEEGEEGVFCVGAPILTHKGKPMGAVSLAGPVKRINCPQTLPKIILGVMECARTISSSLTV